LHSNLEAFIDIETTGLSPEYSDITIVGIHLCQGEETRFIQLIREQITAESLLTAISGVHTIYTYNGARFDLPFIRRHLGINLAELYMHRDLMYDCWRNRLYGGLKCVEQQLGIPRRLRGMNGYDAVRLWWRYVNDYDEGALAMLLEYNREDVLNLKALRDLLLG